MASWQGGPSPGRPLPASSSYDAPSASMYGTGFNISIMPNPVMPPLSMLNRPNVPPTPVSLQQPMLLTTFSYDENKYLCLDDRSKRWYKLPPTQENSTKGADLNYGFDHFQDKPHIPDPLDSVLYAMMHRAQAGEPDVEPIKGGSRVPAEHVEMEMLRAQVLTWRGIMTKLCTAWSCHVQAPPMFREGFELNVMMLGDTLIMEEVPPTMHEIAMLSRLPPKPKRARLGTYYGYSFESYCTKDQPGYTQQNTPGSVPGWGGDVNTNQQWCHIVKTRLGPHRIILGGEVDCVETLDPLTEKERENVVELKTNMQLRSNEDEMKLDIKMLKMYMQSFLLGVQSIVVGFRDPKGTLLSHKSYKTSDLPRLVRGKPTQWNANDNLAFGASILDFVRQTVKTEMERWCHSFSQRVRANERVHGAYAWHVHRGTTSFLGHLPLPAPQDAEQEYPVFRVSFQPPFSQVMLRYVHPQELYQDGRREHRCGLVPTDFYRWATCPIGDVLQDIP